MISPGAIAMTSRNDFNRKLHYIANGNEPMAANAAPDDECNRPSVQLQSAMPQPRVVEETLDRSPRLPSKNCTDYDLPCHRNSSNVISRNIAVFAVVLLVGGFFVVQSNPQFLTGDGQTESGSASPKSGQPGTLDSDQPTHAAGAINPSNLAIEKKSMSEERNPTTIDEVLRQAIVVDEEFSRLKLQLAELQRAEQRNQNRLQQTDRLTMAMTTGQLELSLGGDTSNKSKIPLTYVPPGWFQMGHTEEQRRAGARASSASHYDFSVPDHLIHVSTGYFIGVYEVPNFQMRAFLTATRQLDRAPETSSTLSEIEQVKPATNVDWATAMGFCDWLSELNQISVRLPSEVEWEYAARGNRYLQQFESQRETSVVIGGPWPVNQKTLDRGWCGTYGLRDNVQEWCIDAWDDNAYQDRFQVENGDGKPFAYSPSLQSVDKNAILRSVRGSSFRDVAANIDPALRRYKAADTSDDTVGFRIVVPVPAELYNPRK